MGAGKSTIGRLLAANLHYEFFDTDHVIEKRTGANIPWIFDVEGEAGFRARETNILKELVQEKNTVIATGGGIVMAAENQAILKSCDCVIYLTATIEQLVNRTARDKKRPLLQVDNPRQKIEELYDLRDPLYTAVATFHVPTGSSSPKNVIQKIVDLLDQE